MTSDSILITNIALMSDIAIKQQPYTINGHQKIRQTTSFRKSEDIV